MLKALIAIIVLVIVLAGGIFIGKSGFGTGNGSGEGSQQLSIVEEDNNEELSENEEIVIAVEEEKIYVNGEECADIEDMTDKISTISSQNKDIKYVFEYEYAIKATYDEVREALVNLEETLGISVDYKE